MDYTPIVRTAKQQIDDKGRMITLRTMSEGTYDPVNDTFTDSGIADVPVKAVFVDYKDTEVDDTIIQRGDKRCLIADVTVKPEVNDTIIDGSDQYKVINVQTVQPGDTPILYKLQVRK